MPRWYKCLGITIDLDHVLAVTDVEEQESCDGTGMLAQFSAMMALREKPIYFNNIENPRNLSCEPMKIFEAYKVHGARRDLLRAIGAYNVELAEQNSIPVHTADQTGPTGNAT